MQKRDLRSELIALANEIADLADGDEVSDTLLDGKIALCYIKMGELLAPYIQEHINKITHLKRPTPTDKLEARKAMSYLPDEAREYNARALSRIYDTFRPVVGGVLIDRDQGELVARDLARWRADRALPPFSKLGVGQAPKYQDKLEAIIELYRLVIYEQKRLGISTQIEAIEHIFGSGATGKRGAFPSATWKKYRKLAKEELASIGLFPSDIHRMAETEGANAHSQLKDASRLLMAAKQ